MSWAAHELESYVVQKHLPVRISYLAVLTGCLAPDMMTKLWVYGSSLGGHQFGASNPAAFHRGWPGLGFTHSLTFGFLIAAVVLWRTQNRAWALGLLIGQWAHALTDVNDSVGTMLFFPFSTTHTSAPECGPTPRRPGAMGTPPPTTAASAWSWTSSGWGSSSARGGS